MPSITWVFTWQVKIGPTIPVKIYTNAEKNDLLFPSEILCFLALVGFQIPCWVFRLKLVLSQKVVHDGERAVVKLQGGWFMRPELVKPGRASPAKEGFSFVFLFQHNPTTYIGFPLAEEDTPLRNFVSKGFIFYLFYHRFYADKQLSSYHSHT